MLVLGGKTQEQNSCDTVLPTFRTICFDWYCMPFLLRHFNTPIIDHNSNILFFSFFVSGVFILGVPILHSWDFTVFFTAASTSTPEWSPIQVLTMAKLLNFSDLNLSNWSFCIINITLFTEFLYSILSPTWPAETVWQRRASKQHLKQNGNIYLV